jgi:hypothetical protein
VAECTEGEVGTAKSVGLFNPHPTEVNFSISNDIEDIELVRRGCINNYYRNTKSLFLSENTNTAPTQQRLTLGI